MNKWRLLITMTSLVMLFGGVSALTGHDRRVESGTSDVGWFYLALGLLGIFVLVVPRAGYLVAAVQLLATIYALWLCVLAFMLALAWSGMPWYVWYLSPLIPAAMFSAASVIALLCGVNAVSAWQIARLTKRGSRPGASMIASRLEVAPAPGH